MRKRNYLLPLVVLFSMVLGLGFASCDKDDDVDLDQQLYLYPWKDHPKSYIKFFDYRFELGNLDIKRNGSALQVNYTLTNIGFGKEISLTFVMPRDAAHDNLGNTYECGEFEYSSDVIAYINGNTYSVYGWGRSVNFMPHQTIKGSFTIKNFDRNATAFSITTYVSSSDNIDLAYDQINFVNIPVPPATDDEDDIPML